MVHERVLEVRSLSTLPPSSAPRNPTRARPLSRKWVPAGDARLAGADPAHRSGGGRGRLNPSVLLSPLTTQEAVLSSVPVVGHFGARSDPQRTLWLIDGSRGVVSGRDLSVPILIARAGDAGRDPRGDGVRDALRVRADRSARAPQRTYGLLGCGDRERPRGRPAHPESGSTRDPRTASRLEIHVRLPCRADVGTVSEAFGRRSVAELATGPLPDSQVARIGRAGAVPEPWCDAPAPNKR